MLACHVIASGLNLIGSKKNASNNFYIRSMAGIIFIHIPQIVDGTTQHLHSLVTH